jgi:uncharacterized protein YegP (UPF0339 family)
MSLNQLYHDHGVAQTRAQHAGTVDLRAGHAAEALLADNRIRAHQTAHATLISQTADKFEVFRSDEVQVTSTQFVGGDWRWRLADSDGATLVEGSGYPSERACLIAISLLRARASSAG